MAEMFRGPEPAGNRMSPWQPQAAVLVSDSFLTSADIYSSLRSSAERSFSNRSIMSRQILTVSMS